MGAYACTAQSGDREFEASAVIGNEAVVLEGEGIGSASVSFADIMDLRLLNYHLHVHLREGEVVLSKLGYQTEEFFDKLWDAFAAMSERALFVEGARIMSCEGDYSYWEGGASAASIARLSLHPDCLTIVPHDVGARRVPLCFADAPARDGFALELQLDTGERYRIARLGGNTDPFFERLATLRERSVTAWESAHRELERNLSARLGGATSAHEAFCSLPAQISYGLFSADDDAFWFSAAREGRAAVELVTGEKAATYLYRFDVSPESFVASLRHAMEAVKKNRQLIFLPEDELDANPLYRMAVDRSSHVRFLRTCNAGRIIHTASWAEKLEGFFGS